MFDFLKRKEQPCSCGQRLRGDQTKVTDSIYDDWMKAADDRETPIFLEIAAILDAHRTKRPVKVMQMKQDLKWLRREAAAIGLDWGKA